MTSQYTSVEVAVSEDEWNTSGPPGSGVGGIRALRVVRYSPHIEQAEMSFSPKPGCPLCGVVSAARDSPSHNILHRDDNFTAYHETANPVSSKGHIIIAFKSAVPLLFYFCSSSNVLPSVTASMSPPFTCSSVPPFFFIYICQQSDFIVINPQSSSDLPLLVQVRDLATRLLTELAGKSSTDVPVSPISASPRASTFMASTPTTDTSNFRIGFITPPWKDSKIPVTDHLHAHAYVLPADKLGWWRGVAYGGLAWYAIEDLIAEIRYVLSHAHIPIRTG